MAPHYPQSATGLNYATYPVGPDPLAPTITASASANTKGAYLQIVASTGFASNRTIVNIQQTNANAGRQFLCDLATGAGGAETVVVSNIPAEGSGATSLMPAGIFDFLLAIAASTRIAMRIQSGTGSSVVLAQVAIVAAGGTPGFTTTTTYGDNTADSGGTSVDPGATLNTKGAYSQITASTSAVIQHLLFATTFGGNTAPIASKHYLDLATGAGGAEVVLIPDSPIQAMTAGASLIQSREPKSQAYLTYIAASTRLAVRASSDINNATDRLIDAFIIGAVAPASGGEDSGLAGGGGVPGTTQKAYTFHA